VELASMCDRLRSLRMALAGEDRNLAQLADQNGLFAMLPLDREAVIRLRGDAGIYMADSGRINVAGLARADVARFAAEIAGLSVSA
jgi:aromatic-amino-acid transaminase